MCSRHMMVVKMFAFGLASASLLLACSSGQTQTREESPPPSPPAVAERKEPATAQPAQPYVISGKTYYPPVALRWSDMHMEGGTRFVNVVDARGQKLMACNDAAALLNRSGEAIDRPIYVGGEHPTHKGSKPLPLGGADELELYRMLKDWADGGRTLGGPPSPRELEPDRRAEAAQAFLSFLERHIERHRPK